MIDDKELIIMLVSIILYVIIVNIIFFVPKWKESTKCKTIYGLIIIEMGILIYPFLT